MWSQTVGLVNGQYKYLTAETFGHKINANGAGLKKKQQWTVEPYPLEVNGSAAVFEEMAELEYVAIKSHLNCYLAVDSFGNVTCESQERNKGARFIITICSMSSGTGEGEHIYWAFKNVERGYYLGATPDGMISCQAKMPQSRAELWHVHLIPARGATMFALKSIGRKRFARALPYTLNDGGRDVDKCEQIQVDATTPWGPETLFQFKYYEAGRYALLTSSCKYLTCDGACIEWTPAASPTNGVQNGGGLKNGGTSHLPPAECLFTIEYHGGNIAFRDYQGRYLAGAGRASILRTRSNNVSRDELFEFSKAPIQVALRATFNGKWVSIKQGVDVSANQNDITSQHETFELEYNAKTDSWHLSSKEGNLWALGVASTIQAAGRDKKSCAHFKIKWNPEDGTCSILTSAEGTLDEGSMKWICARKSGQLFTGSQEPVRFYLMFQNRTSLNLRASTGSGFVGVKVPGSGKLESNKTAPDSILVEYANNEHKDDIKGTFNCCYFKMPANNKYWSVIDGNQVASDSASATCAQQFQLELRSGSTIAIRLYENSTYLNLTNQGLLTLSKCGPNEATLWEF